MYPLISLNINDIKKTARIEIRKILIEITAENNKYTRAVMEVPVKIKNFKDSIDLVV